MKRLFRFSAGMDMSVTVEVNLDQLTPPMASEINNFWAFSDKVLDVSDGDPIVAASRRAATRFLGALLEGCNKKGAQAELDESEGWPPNGTHGIRLIDFDLPDMGSTDLELEELTA